MKNFALVAFALIGYWFISNPYNGAVLSQGWEVMLNRVMINNVSPDNKKEATRQLAISEYHLMKLKMLRDAVQ